MNPQICLNIEDGFADVYAMHTLYTYLVENNFQADFKAYSIQVAHLLRFNNRIRESGVGKVFKPDRVLQIDERERWPDVILAGHSDANSYLLNFPERVVSIDLSILKNCVKPTTKEQKSELRKKYNIQEDKPVVVVGFYSTELCCEESLEKILNSICKDASVYLVGSVKFEGRVCNILQSQVKIVDENGVLKDYYAMADITLMNKRTSQQDNMCHLHNFIESTAGGPLFLVEPNNKLQYGYRQLRDLEVIREAESTEDLIAKVKNYFQYPEEEKVRERRTMHLEHSRNLYLPDILRLINRVLGKSNEPFESNLLAEVLPPKRPFVFQEYSPRIAIYHPETKWDFQKAKDLLQIENIPKQIYKSFGRER